MMKLKWEAKKEDGFEGSAMLTLPNYKQRLKYIKECNFSLKTDGEVSVNSDQLDSIIKLVEIAEEHIGELELKHLDSGVVVKSYVEMQDYPQFDGLVSELASMILNGGQMGKN